MPDVRHVDSDGVTQITDVNWGDSIAGRNQTPRKFGFRNISDRALTNTVYEIQAVTGNDGSTQMRLGVDSATLSAPWGFSASLLAGGGAWSGVGIRGYKITSINANGESGPSDEITINVDDITKRVVLSWVQTPGATGYKIYRTDTPGTYGASSLRTTIGSGATITFTDDGSATTTGTPPTANTTAGWNLTAVLSGTGQGGVWSATGVYYWRVVAVDSTGVEITNTLQATVNVDEATKKVALSWAAVAQAANIKVYRSQTPNSWPSPALVATLAGGATTYDDTGTAVQTGGSTSLQSYGIPPASFGSSALSLPATFDIGRDFFFWVNRVIPSGTPEAGNPRQAITAAKET